MTSQKPYLIRAIFDWLLDNKLTPYLLVNTLIDGVKVPDEYINDDKIVLNIAPDAVQHFQADNQWISFSARFSGRAMELFIPIEAIQGIYGKENNEGMFFTDEDKSLPPTPPSKPLPTKERPSLKLVK
ncbi:MAG: stringent starvation protein B [Methylophagaceae bacterium]|jgi:stringent starvation protein B